jgi:protein involved in polysaccharide export with SLBB domain
MKTMGQFCGCSGVHLAAFFFGLVSLAGCRHTPSESPYAALDVSATGQPAASVTPAEKMQTVELPNKLDPAWFQPPADLYTLGPGDRVEIEVLGDPTSRTMTVVGPDGKIYFSLLAGIDVWGASLAQAKGLLENELAKFVREKPQVSIVLRGIESKRIWVLGRVQAPGVYAMTTPMTLLEAVSMAGGTLSLANYRDQEAAGISEELADLSRSFVIRQGRLLPIDFARLLKIGDMSQNIYLQPDDFVYLPAARAREIYVLGAVAQPRAVAWTEGMTVAGAVASAYGTIKGAYMHHVAVVRGSLTQPQMAVVDYKRVIRGEATDIALQPHDIVYVPFSPYRYIDKYLELVLNTFVSAAAINAGSHAVSTQPTGGAGVFIPVGSGVSIIPPVNPPPIR